MPTPDTQYTIPQPESTAHTHALKLQRGSRLVLCIHDDRFLPTSFTKHIINDDVSTTGLQSSSGQTSIQCTCKYKITSTQKSMRSGSTIMVRSLQLDVSFHGSNLPKNFLMHLKIKRSHLQFSSSLKLVCQSQLCSEMAECIQHRSFKIILQRIRQKWRHTNDFFFLADCPTDPSLEENGP